MLKFLQIVFALVAFCVYAINARPDKVVCYYGSWSVYRPGLGKVDVENIDTNKCTHIIYSFVGINTDGSIKVLDPWNEESLDALGRFNRLKLSAPHLKTLVAIGGWNEGSAKFSQVAASATLRQKFAKNALSFIEKHNFDGFDLDWEYPAQREGSSWADKQNVNLMLEALRKTFDASGKKYLITAAVGASANSADLSYDIPIFSKYLDFINLMAYDFHGSFDGKTGQNAPLYASSVVANKQLNVDAAVKAWIGRGAPANKIVLGMGTYGRSFTVSGTLNMNKNFGLNTQAGPGTAGPYTRERGMLGYNEICSQKRAGGWTEFWDDEQKVPVIYSGDQWVGYDNEKSIKIKAEYAIAMGLGGAMIWSIETDDVYGECGRRYPLLSSINEILFGSPNVGGSGGGAITTTTKKPAVTTSKVTTTTKQSGTCTDGQLVRDSSDCNVYYLCSGNLRTHKFNCPSNLYFNNVSQNCDWPANVPECK